MTDQRTLISLLHRTMVGWWDLVLS